MLDRPLRDLKDPNEFEPREQDQAAQTAGLDGIAGQVPWKLANYLAKSHETRKT